MALKAIPQAFDEPIVPQTPLWIAAAFAAGLGLSMLTYLVRAAPATGDDTVQSLYDALLITMKNESHTRPKWPFYPAGAGHSSQLRHHLDDAVVGRAVLGRSDRDAAPAGERDSTSRRSISTASTAMTDRSSK